MEYKIIGRKYLSGARGRLLRNCELWLKYFVCTHERWTRQHSRWMFGFYYGPIIKLEIKKGTTVPWWAPQTIRRNWNIPLENRIGWGRKDFRYNRYSGSMRIQERYVVNRTVCLRVAGWGFFFGSEVEKGTHSKAGYWLKCIDAWGSDNFQG